MTTALSARADDVILSNGFRLRIARQEKLGSRVRLYIPGGGYVDVAASEIQGYEKEDTPPASPETGPAGMSALVTAAGARQGLDPALLESMIAEESGFNPYAISPKGAAGLMQLMPGTARLLGVKNFFSATDNVFAGARYIRSLLERYRGNLGKALAAYNAGPATVDRYRGIPPYAETQNYVRRVITRFNREKTGH